jgi:hypothetical protein
MIETEVTDGAAALRSVRGFPGRLEARLAAVMQRLGSELQDRVRDQLSGGALRQRSGRLASGIELDIASAGNSIAVSIDAGGVPYAAYEEYGFHGTETVRAHLRTIREAFGRAIAPRTIAIQSYARRVDYPAHSFLRSALSEIAPDALAQIDAAVGDEAAA